MNTNPTVHEVECLIFQVAVVFASHKYLHPNIASSQQIQVTQYIWSESLFVYVHSITQNY